MRLGRILIALDHGSLAAHVADFGVELAGRLGAEVALVHAVDPMMQDAARLGGNAAYLIARAMMVGRSLLEQVAKRARVPSAPLEFIPVGHPAAEIVKTALDWEAELLIIGGPQGNGGKREPANRVGAELLVHAPCPIVVVRSQGGA